MSDADKCNGDRLKQEWEIMNELPNLLQAGKCRLANKDQMGSALQNAMCQNRLPATVINKICQGWERSKVYER